MSPRPRSSFSSFEGGMAAKESGEKTEREPHGRCATAEEAPHGLFQLHSCSLEEPALEAAPCAGIVHISATCIGCVSATGCGPPSGVSAWTVSNV